MKDLLRGRRFVFVILGCVVVFSLVGFLIGTTMRNAPVRSETIRGGSSIQPQFVESLSAWVYIPSPQTNEARIEIRSGSNLSLPVTVVTGTPGQVIQYSGSISINILQVNPAPSDSPPGSGLVVIQIVDDSGVNPRIFTTASGACVGLACALVLWGVRKRIMSRSRP